MTINTFNDDAVSRIQRAVIKSEKSPLQGPSYRRRGRGRSKKVESTDAPFQISITSIEGVTYASVSDGIVYTDIQNYIPEGLVDLSSYVDGQRVYIYLKVANNWLSNGELLNYPVLTVHENTNFGSNSSLFPLADFGNYFFQIGTVDVSDVGGNLTYTVTQIASDNASIETIETTSFNFVPFLSAKASDTATDSNLIYIVGGQVSLPDVAPVIPTTSTTKTLAQDLFGYLKISTTLNEFSFPVDYQATTEFATSVPANTSTINYYQLGRMNGQSVTISQLKTPLSDGIIW